MSEIAQDSQRCDVFLFRARLFKSRSAAGQFIEKGAVRVEAGGAVRRLRRAAAPVRPGDTLVYMRSGSLVRLTILQLGERRGPASEAQQLYSLEPSLTAPGSDRS